MILARAAYLGAQRNGTVFWSSDIVSTWDMLKRSIPASLDFTATGLPYWDTDIAGFYPPTLPADYHAAHKPLIDGSDARNVIGNDEDYPELFTRWFEWGCFQPVMRAHGARLHNEVWPYGKQAEQIVTVGFTLDYVTPDGSRSNYIADFIVNLTNGAVWIVETKGREDENDPGKWERL